MYEEENSYQEDTLGAGRGLMIGLFIGTLLWAIAIIFFIMVIRAS